MSGKQSAKPRLGGVFFFVRLNFTMFLFLLPHLQRCILWMHHILQQRTQQGQCGLLTLHIATDQPHF